MNPWEDMDRYGWRMMGLVGAVERNSFGTVTACMLCGIFVGGDGSLPSKYIQYIQHQHYATLFNYVNEKNKSN